MSENQHPIVALAQDIIAMRKYPLKNNAQQRYPAAAQQFDAMAATCDDLSALREVIDSDTGHVLPPTTKQRIFERLLAVQAQRTPAILRAFAMHLVMFGYVDEQGNRRTDVDDKVNALYDEAEASSSW